MFGLEADIQASGANDTFAPWKFSNPWFGTVRGRAGYALNNVLFYGPGAGLRRIARPGFWRDGIPTPGAGWTAGVGGEFGFAPNWTAKIEYLYVDLSDSRFAITGMPNGYRFGLVRLGVNYRF